MVAGDVYRVAGPYFVLLAPYRHYSSTLDYVIDLFKFAMLVRRNRMAGRQRLFGEAALGYCRRSAIDQRTNLGAVGGVDDLGAFPIYDDHSEWCVVRSP